MQMQTLRVCKFQVFGLWDPCGVADLAEGFILVLLGPPGIPSIVSSALLRPVEKFVFYIFGPGTT